MQIVNTGNSIFLAAEVPFMLLLYLVGIKNVGQNTGSVLNHSSLNDSLLDLGESPLREDVPGWKEIR